MSNTNFVFVKKTLSTEASELIEVNTSARNDRFDWMENERGIDLSLIDKENSIQEYLEERKERLDWIASRKQMLHIWSNGASEEKKMAMRREYKALLIEEMEILSPVKEMEKEIDSSFSTFQDNPGEYLDSNTNDKQLFDFFKLYVDTMSSEELNNSVDYLQLEFESGAIYYNTWVELSLVSLSRARKLITPKSHCKQGIAYLQDPETGIEEEYQKFLSMYQHIVDRNREREAALPFYETYERQYLTESEIISYIDGMVELDWDDMNPIPFIMNEHTKVLDALIGTNGNKSAAGRLLGVSPRTIGRRLIKAAEAAREAKIV